MHGLMMNRPLSVIEILSFAAEIHGNREIVSVRTEGDWEGWTRYFLEAVSTIAEK